MAGIVYSSEKELLAKEASNELVNAFASDVSNPVITPAKALRKLNQDTAKGDNRSPHVTENASELESTPARHTGTNEDPVTMHFKARQEGPEGINRNMEPQDYAGQSNSPKIASQTVGMKKYRVWDIDKLLEDVDNISGVDQEMLLDQYAHPLAILLGMAYWFGGDWLEWEPETLWSEIAEELKVLVIPQLIKDKIMAVRAAHHINDYYDNWQSMEKLVVTFNHHIPDFSMMQAPDIKELCNGVTILNQIREDDEFGDEIKLWIKCIATIEGFAVLPPLLQFVEEPDGLMFEEVIIRMKDLETAPEKFDPESVVDNQAMKILEAHAYVTDQEEMFSDDINKYFFFERGEAA